MHLESADRVYITPSESWLDFKKKDRKEKQKGSRNRKSKKKVRKQKNEKKTIDVISAS